MGGGGIVRDPLVHQEVLKTFLFLYIVIDKFTSHGSPNVKRIISPCLVIVFKISFLFFKTKNKNKNKKPHIVG